MELGLQLIAHAIGDYALQSGWMANNKTRSSVPALVHATVYMIPFWFIFHPSLTALFVMWSTHFVIDRWRLARYVVYAKEYISPPAYWVGWGECSATGLPSTVPPFMAVWLMIIVDNLMHVTINALALAYL